MTHPARVRISNAERGTVLAESCRVASSARDRTVGLLATPRAALGDGLFIERAPSIHMFFMRYPIDAVFIDSRSRVVHISESLRPWRIVAWARGARDCYEAPVGTVRRTATAVGDQLLIEPVTAD